jgi:hypothetical protein
MTDPFDLLRPRPDDSTALDEATRDRMARRVADHMASAAGARPRQGRLHLARPRGLGISLTLKVASAVFVVALAAAGIAVSQIARSPSRHQPSRRPAASSGLADWTIVSSPASAAQLFASFESGGSGKALSAINAATGVTQPLPLTGSVATSFFPLADPSSMLVGIDYDSRSPGAGYYVLASASAQRVLRVTSLVGTIGVAAAPNGHDLWIERDAGKHVDAAVVPPVGPCSIEQATMLLEPVTPPHPISCRWILKTALSDGAVMVDGGTAVSYFAPGMSTPWTIAANARYLGLLDEEYVVWQGPATTCPTCSVYATNVVTHQTVRLAVPQQPPGDSGQSVPVFSVGTADEAVVRWSAPHLAGGADELVVEDAFTGQVVAIRQLSAAGAASTVEWSPDGRFVFVTEDPHQLFECPVRSSAPSATITLSTATADFWVLRTGS